MLGCAAATLRDGLMCVSVPKLQGSVRATSSSGSGSNLSHDGGGHSRASTVDPDSGRPSLSLAIDSMTEHIRARAAAPEPAAAASAAREAAVTNSHEAASAALRRLRSAEDLSVALQGASLTAGSIKTAAVAGRRLSSSGAAPPVGWGDSGGQDGDAPPDSPRTPAAWAEGFSHSLSPPPSPTSSADAAILEVAHGGSVFSRLHEERVAAAAEAARVSRSAEAEEVALSTGYMPGD